MKMDKSDDKSPNMMKNAERALPSSTSEPPPPGLMATLPDAVQLRGEYDVTRLVADLEQLSRHKWGKQRPYTYTDSGPGVVVEYDWRVLSLRSIGGAADRTDPGGPGLAGYANTHWLSKASYLAEVLDDIPGPLRSVRLMALGPGASTPMHVDTKCGFPWGRARLHIPITTDPGAILRVGESVYQWQPGTFWFGNFARPHQVQNTGTGRRVHMVIDTYATPALVDLFPNEVRTMLVESDVLFLRPEVLLDAQTLEEYRCRFWMPKSFANWKEPDGQFLLPQDKLKVSLEPTGAELVMSISGHPTFGLVHVGCGEFRLQGWSDERSIRIDTVGSTPMATLLSRQGGSLRELRVEVTVT